MGRVAQAVTKLAQKRGAESENQCVVMLHYIQTQGYKHNIFTCSPQFHDYTIAMYIAV